jgi:predicted acylesterase/phospholipase RssA
MSGCAYVNQRLDSVTVPLESRRTNHTRAATGETSLGAVDADTDGYFVGLALSGGGSRSANFAAACMFELQRLGILQHVDYISSVSGGSMAAAYYCLAGDEWNPGTAQKRLTHSFATDVIFTTFLPWNLFIQLTTAWDRSDVLADSFERVLFTRKGKALTYADLRPDRPHLLINATDLQSGRRFVFSNESFNEINSDLSKYPIANAVAASAAVPVLLHQVTLRDFSTAFERYRHLLDGGINDNLGVTTLVEACNRQRDLAAAQLRPDPYPNGMILIVIDAHTNFDTELGDKPDIGLIESLTAGAGLTSTALLNRVSSATLAELIVDNSPDETTAQTLREQIRQLEKNGSLKTHDRHGKPVQVINLSLSRTSDLTNLPFASFSQRVNNIATYFNIDPDEAFHLYKAAELLVRDETFAKPLAEVKNALDGNKSNVH